MGRRLAASYVTFCCTFRSHLDTIAASEYATVDDGATRHGASAGSAEAAAAAAAHATRGSSMETRNGKSVDEDQTRRNSLDSNPIAGFQTSEIQSVFCWRCFCLFFLTRCVGMPPLPLSFQTDTKSSKSSCTSHPAQPHFTPCFWICCTSVRAIQYFSSSISFFFEEKK